MSGHCSRSILEIRTDRWLPYFTVSHYLLCAIKWQWIGYIKQSIFIIKKLTLFDELKVCHLFIYLLEITPLYIIKTYEVVYVCASLMPALSDKKPLLNTGQH